MRQSADRAAASLQTEAYIKSQYGKEPNEKIASHLGITKLELQVLARQFGLAVKIGNSVAYTPEEDDFLRANHKTMTMTEMGAAINRSRDAIGSRLVKLKLREKETRYSNLSKRYTDCVDDKKDYCRRRRMLQVFMSRVANPTTPEQHLAYAVVMQAVKDIGTSDDAMCDMVSGSLDYWLQQIDIEPDFFVDVLRTSGLVTEQHRAHMRARLIAT